VLFTDDVVTGVIDFDALGIDSIATDLARLIGSLVEDNPGGWQTALEAYDALRPIHDREQRLIQVLDHCNVVISGLQWLHWIFLEQRTFENWKGVHGRLTDIHRRLAHRTGG
jgi:homoserine kinase type II